MKVWIVNPFDNLPVEGYRPQRYWMMAEAFAAAGHETTLWTQNWSHAKKSRREEIPSGSSFVLKYVRVPGYSRNICFKRIWSHWRFAANWATESMLAGEVPDLVIVSSPPLLAGRAVRRFCARTGAKYIVDIMDAWPETFERVLPRWALLPMRLVAKGNYLAAHGISAVTKSYLSLAAGYGAGCPMLLCHHGIRIPAGSGPERKREAPDLDRIRLAYAGNMSLSYDLATVIDAVKEDSALSIDLAGSGPDEPSLRARAGDCPRIRFHGYLDDAGLRSMLAKADVGVVPMFDESCVGVPYKLADYAAAGLPVVSSLHGETAELLEECAAGITYAARDPAAFSSAVRRASAIGSGCMRLAQRFDADRLYLEYVEFACETAMRPNRGDARHGQALI